MNDTHTERKYSYMAEFARSRVVRTGDESYRPPGKGPKGVSV